MLRVLCEYAKIIRASFSDSFCYRKYRILQLCGDDAVLKNYYLEFEDQLCNYLVQLYQVASARELYTKSILSPKHFISACKSLFSGYTPQTNDKMHRNKLLNIIKKHTNPYTGCKLHSSLLTVGKAKKILIRAYSNSSYCTILPNIIQSLITYAAALLPLCEPQYFKKLTALFSLLKVNPISIDAHTQLFDSIASRYSDILNKLSVTS
jgi:hypothetical protein